MRKLSLNVRYNSASTEPSNTDRRNIPLVTNSWCNWCLKIHISSPSTASLSSCSWNRVFFAVWSAQLRLRCVCVDDCYYSWIAAWLAPHLAESGWTGNRANDPPGNTRAITETQSTSKCVSDRDVLQSKPLDSLDYWNRYWRCSSLVTQSVIWNGHMGLHCAFLSVIVSSCVLHCKYSFCCWFWGLKNMFLKVSCVQLFFVLFFFFLAFPHLPFSQLEVIFSWQMGKLQTSHSPLRWECIFHLWMERIRFHFSCPRLTKLC